MARTSLSHLLVRMARTRRSQLAVFTLIIGICSAGPVRADFQLIPNGLKPGDQFRAVFVSSTTRNAVSPNATSYDSFIAGLASSAGISTYFGTAITWQALVSTFEFAGNNTIALARLPTSSPALYRVDGALVANSGADLWDNSIANAINRTETNAAIPGTGFNPVWTGTAPNGLGAFGRTLGDSLPPFFGTANATNSTWITDDALTSTSLARVYGFSSVLTVPTAVPSVVPEPSSLVVLMLGLTGIAGVALRQTSSLQGSKPVKC